MKKSVLAVLLCGLFAARIFAVPPEPIFQGFPILVADLTSSYATNYKLVNLQADASGNLQVISSTSAVQTVIFSSTTAKATAYQGGYWIVDSTTTIDTLNTLFKQGQTIGNTSFYALPIDFYNVSGSSVSVPDGVNVNNFPAFATESTVNNISTITADMNGRIYNVMNYTQDTSTLAAALNGKVTKCDTDNISDVRYTGKTSTGTCGLITNVTSAQIAVTDNVANYSFIYSNDADKNQYAEITGSFTGTIYLKDGQSVDIPVEVPQPITFNLASLSAGATMQYVIPTLK